MTLLILLFFAVVAGLAALPLLPAIREWRRPTDTAPLMVAQHSEVDIRHLANAFRSWLDARLGEARAECRRSGALQEAELDGARCVVVPDGGARFLTEAEARSSRCERVVVGCGDLRLPDCLVAVREIAADGDITGGSNATYRALLAGGDIVLGRHSHTLRWAHAGKTLYVGAGSHTLGRASADQAVVLGVGAAFERVHAPRVVAGAFDAGHAPAAARVLPVLEPRQLRSVRRIEVGAGRWWIKGDVEIPPDVRVEANLVVTGACRIRHGVVLAGSVKARRDLVIDDDVEVRGSVVGQRDLTVGSRCRIAGPVVAERAAQVGEHTVIGEPDRLTTVSASELTLSLGTVVHGTAWAHRRGHVAAPSAERHTNEARGVA